MGKQGRPWRTTSDASSKSWEYWRGARSPRQPKSYAQPSASFPAYDTISPDAVGITEVWETRQVPPSASSGSSLVQLVQAAVNQTRKLDARTLRLEKALKTKHQCWNKYVSDMRQSYRKERERHQQHCQKLEEELREAVAQQQSAHKQLSVFMPQLQQSSTEQDDGWNSAIGDEEMAPVLRNPLHELGQFLAAARSAGGLPADAGDPLRMMGAAAPSSFGPAPVTPPHRPNFGVPVTPPSGPVAAKDPYISSPASTSLAGDGTGHPPAEKVDTKGHPSPPSASGQRPYRAHRRPPSQEVPRKSIKEASKSHSPVTDPKRSTLGDKLLERRQKELEAQHPEPPIPLPPEAAATLAGSGGGPGVIPAPVILEDDDELDEVDLFASDGELKTMECAKMRLISKPTVNVMLRLPSAEGGAPSVIRQAKAQASLRAVVVFDLTTIGGIVAIAPRETGPVEASFTFVDARKVGRGIRAFLSNVWVEASAILRCIDPKVPPGYSVSLCTSACATLEAGDVPWDWQEVFFRTVDDDLTDSSVPLPVTDQPMVTEPTETTVADRTEPCRTDESMGIYAALSSGPPDPAHLPVERPASSAPPEGVWFLLFAPDRRPEHIWIVAQAPYTWDEASAALAEARDPKHQDTYGYICRVHPQPSAEFASLICLPSWASQRTAVLLDSRSFDGRLFCLIIDPWIQWGSFLLHAGLPDTDTFVVVVNGISRVRGRPLILKQGDLIQVLEYGASIPPALDLGDLLFVGDKWEADPPLAFSSSFSHFWVLHEGGAKGIDADYHAIDNVYGFQEFVADTLQFAQHRTSLKTASPQILDGVYRGVLCKAVVIVTECLPTIPVPPARITVSLTVVFLDMRPVLRGIDWRILARGETALDVFTRGLHLEPPQGYRIHIEGGHRVTRKRVVFLKADDRAVLTVSYVEQTDAAPETASTESNDSSDSGGDSDSAPDDGDPNRVARGTHAAVRSVIDDLLREIGSGWRLWLRDVPFSADILATREGQILAVEVIHERIVPPQGGIEVSDEAVTAPVEAATAPSATPGPANTEPAPATGPSQGAQYEAEDTTVTHDRADDGPPGSPEDSRPDARAPVADLEHANVPFLVLKQNYDHEWVTVRLVAGVDVHDALNAAAAARLPAAAVRIALSIQGTVIWSLSAHADGDVVTLAFRQSDTATASSDHMADDAQPAPADDDEEEPNIWAAAEYLPVLHPLILERSFSRRWSAEGSWQTLSHTGAIVHHLDMLARATPGVQLKYSHVKGHSDHPWNDLADYVAKDASRGNVWPSPPADVCTALHTQDLTWLAVEQDARRHHAVPIYDGAVLLESPATCTACLQPEHLVPVTGGDCTQRDTTGHRCWASVATVNVQSLRGKCKYIEEQLHSRAVNVACLQETKLDDGTITSQYYLRIHSKAESHWGVAIWVHRQLGIVCLGGEPLHVDEHDVAILHASPRLLVLLITKGQPRIGLISGHCPHSTRPAERDEFLALTAPLLRRLKHANLVLGGLDLNGRIPPNYQDVSGALEYGEPDATGWNFARLLAESGLWVPSLYTQLHCGDSATYTHPSGTQHRIDYTLLGGQAVLEKVRSEVDDTFGNGSPQDDHMLLCLSFQGHLETRGHTHRLRRTRYDRDKIMSTEGRACLSRLLPTFCQPGWHVAPDQHCRAIEHHLCHILEANFPARQTHKRASYIPDRVWHLREKKIEFKRRVRHRSQLWHDLVCRAFHQWKESQDYGVTLLLGKQCRLYELAAAVVKITTGAIKREILQAKNTYLHKVACEGHQGAAKILQRVKQAGIGGTKARPISRPLPMLLHPSDGSTVTTRRQRDEVWMLHFGKQEQGQATPIDAFIKEATYSCYQPDLTWTAAMLPTYADIESVVRAIPRNKAAGLDNIPGEILKAVPAEAARLLLPLFLKSMVLQHQPIQWRGGVLFEAFKRSGLQSSVDNYRSLFVSSYLAKAFHRVVRDKTQAFCRDEMHSLHLGSKKRAPVTFASMYVLAHLRRGSALRQSVSVLYLDTSAAYYRIVRELAVGDIRADSTVLRLFTRFGLTGDDLHELMMTVESGGMLAQAGAPDALRQVVKDIHLHTWFVSRFSDGTQVCSSLAGSRPGESWADLIYAYIYGRVLSKIHEYAVAEDLTFRVSHDPTAGVFPATDPTGFVDATDATWADDSAFPLIAEDPGSLMQKTRRLCTLVISFCEGHGMAPNLKPGKTSVMISLKGKGHNKARQQFFPNGAKKLDLPDLGVGIVVADCYKHLGGYVDCKLSMKQEVRHRLAQASSSYDSARTLLLGNPRLGLATRAALFESAVTPTFFNIGLWIPCGPSWDSLCNGYSKLVRRMLVPNVGAHRAFHVPLPVVHWYTGCWRLELIARRARLSLLVSLVQTGPPLLWAMLQAESTWLQTIQEDLRWLIRGDEEDWPLLAAPAWPAWHHIVNSSPQAFRRRIKRRLRQAHQDYISEDSILVCLWHCYRTVPRHCSEAMPPMQWFCHVCRRSFCSKAGLSVHFFKKHGRVAAYRHVADGTTCAACDTSFWTVGRLAAHLRASPGCVAALAGRGHFVERPAPGFGSRKRRQADSLDFTLSLPDRRGIIPPRPEEPVWGKEQKQTYHDACDVVLEIDSSALVVDIVARISAILFQGPLYYDELLLILDRLSSDVTDLHRADSSDPWGPNTVHNILSALERIKSSLGAPGLPDIQSIPECHSLLAFKQLVTTFEWPKATAPISSADGTLSPKTFTVLSRWEADWRQYCGRVEISAVADDCGVLLPTQLRQAWHHIIGGCTVLLDAPPEFWSHPLAAPFRCACPLHVSSN
ncbi:hypothetical protein AK812_SmicGene16321 [Symbiodinium microadriaticum]|uniref:C2H2-type domain-containing protein n=1 Tax=Symbiodinium microadriaticum TaxID=2951 RepID=A0A1Q9E0M1_SYMMI|nr:hypothetical protein AK812_SmicGene16321 [Symbiodinium microadriaticum]